MLKADKIKIFTEIQKELKEELKIDISLEEINSVVNSQFKIMAYGFSKGIGSHIQYIGKFIPFDMDRYSEKIIIPNKQLQAQLKEENDEIKAKAVFVDSYKRYKSLIRETAEEKEMSAEEVMSVPNIDGSTDNLNIFKDLR